MNLTRIEWIDSYTLESWNEEDEIDLSEDLIITIGFMAKENDDFISIANSWDPYRKAFNCIMIIPKICIRSRDEIKTDDSFTHENKDG